MSKYTEDQLSEMAKRVLQAEKDGDPRFFQLAMTMCIATGLEFDDVMNRIRGMVKE